MRSELVAMVELAQRMLASDVAGTLATLFSARGSTYRPLGLMMVSLPGMRAGGVSGGCLEEHVAREGVLATGERAAAFLSFSTAHESESRVPTLGCGGSIDILVERLTADHVAWLRELAAAADADAPSVLQCLVKSDGPAVEVRRRWMHGPGRTGSVPQNLEDTCRQVLQEGRSRHVLLGAGHRALMHYVPPVTRLVIVGAGDDARPLSDIAKALNWHTTIADRRIRLATVSRFPHADAVLAGAWRTWCPCFPLLSGRQPTYDAQP